MKTAARYNPGIRASMGAARMWAYAAIAIWLLVCLLGVAVG